MFFNKNKRFKVPCSLQEKVGLLILIGVPIDFCKVGNSGITHLSGTAFSFCSLAECICMYLVQNGIASTRGTAGDSAQDLHTLSVRHCLGISPWFTSLLGITQRRKPQPGFSLSLGVGSEIIVTLPKAGFASPCPKTFLPAFFCYLISYTWRTTALARKDA